MRPHPGPCEDRGVLLGEDAVYPYWLERQLDPVGPSFVPGGGGQPPANVTHRDWTLLGTLAALERATVDPRGLVTPVEGGWSLDWWVRAGDRWYLPSQEAAVRQRLVDGSPVVETAMRVPQGDVVHRAYAVRDAEGGSHVVVEVENRSSHAVALALVVRPWGPTGPARVAQVGVQGVEVSVDGRTGVVLPRPPAAVHLATGADGGVAPALLGSEVPDADAAAPEPLTCPEGRAEVAAVVPLAHTATVRALVPVPGVGARRRGRARDERLTLPDPVPSAAQVANGWAVQGGRGPRLVVPDERLAGVVEAARRHLLLVHAGEDLAAVPTVPFDFTEAAAELAALDAFGLHDEAAQVLGTWEERQALDGHLLGDDRRMDANGAALVALADHWRATGDAELVEAFVGPVAKAAHWIGKRCASRRGRRDPATVGLLPDGAGPAWLGDGGAFHDAWWSLRGLRDAAAMLRAVDQPDAAELVEATAGQLDAALADALAGTAARLGTDVIPAGPGRGVDGGVVAVLDAVLLGTLDPRAPGVDATVDLLRQRYVADRAVVQAVGAAGLSPRLTARLARVELARGERTALDRLAWLVERASPTVTWPEVVHPRTGGGAVGAGHDGVATAEVLLAVRDLLARPTVGGLALSSVVPAAWLGQGWEVHGLPTPFGRLGYAVRWHGDRPALLWELDAHEGVGPVELTVPGLDPAWSSDEHRGEALLAPVAPPAEEPEPDGQPDVGPGGEDPAPLVDGVPLDLPSAVRRRAGTDDGGEGR